MVLLLLDLRLLLVVALLAWLDIVGVCVVDLVVLLVTAVLLLRLLLLLIILLLLVMVHRSDGKHWDVHLVMLWWLRYIMLWVHQMATSLLLLESFDVLCRPDLQVLLQQGLQVQSVLLRSRNSQHNHRHWIFVHLLRLMMVIRRRLMVVWVVVAVLNLKAVRLQNLDVGCFLVVGAFLAGNVAHRELVHDMRLGEVVAVMMLVLVVAIAKSGK